MSEKRFAQLFREGKVTEGDVDDYIGAWHDGAGGEVSLHEFLGMTEHEYIRWVTYPPHSLRDILK